MVEFDEVLKGLRCSKDSLFFGNISRVEHGRPTKSD